MSEAGKTGRLVVALVHEVFHGTDADARLAETLSRARRRGAELAVLPELPLDPWIPAAAERREADAERPGGPRQERLARAARESEIALLGGAIVRDPSHGRRTSRAMLLDRRGELVASYDKLHLPQESGYLEQTHYAPGTDPPTVFSGCALPLGIQICSDLHRPSGSQLLRAQGASAILAPRATPAESYSDWLLVMRAAALTSACWLVSVNRPRQTGETRIGGPSVVVAPDGHPLHETEERLSLVELDSEAVRRARAAYPGYLGLPSDVYARGWKAVQGAAERGTGS
jgi:predicted amidohydrolase